MGKPGQSCQAKLGEKGKSKKVQKYIQKCLKIAPNVIKINSIPNNLKISKNHFFPSFPRPTKCNNTQNI
jgi:hypothetical protein